MISISPRLILRAGAGAAFFAVIMLAVQFVIALGIGSDFALLGKALDPARLREFYLANARALTALMTADNAFALGYSLAFAALAYSVAARSRALAALALVFAILTTITDWTENSLTLAGVNLALQGQGLPAVLPLQLYWLADLKFLLIYPAVVLLAVGVWEIGRGGRLFAALLILFPVIGIPGIAIEGLSVLRVLWMLVLLLAGGIYLWKIAATSSRNSRASSAPHGS